MSEHGFLEIRNGEAAEVGSVPTFGAGELPDRVLPMVDRGSRIAAMFGWKMGPGRTRVFVGLAFDAAHHLGLLAFDVGDSYPSLTQKCPQAHLFEREIFEQCGARPVGHPWLKPVRQHTFGPVLESSSNGERFDPGQHGFFSMHGHEVHEVAVGPVHAGVIEPGHFRFQCHGEVVHHLEIQLGYQQRGVEELLLGDPCPQSLLQMEAVAGDTTVGHATAYCSVLEALGDVQVPERGNALRALALELERLANHVGDIGALSNDVGFLPTASYCGRMRGDFLNMTALLCGSRFGRGLVRPGGVGFDADGNIPATILSRLERLEPELYGAIDLFFDTESARGRLEGTGVLSPEACRDLGVVGLAARASRRGRDCRVDHPAGWYVTGEPKVVMEKGGDVLARALMRRSEIKQSIALVRSILKRLPGGRVAEQVPSLRPGRIALALAEGWRGEIVHVGITDSRGRFGRYKVIDSSFHNWSGLAMALRGQQISDFPLCNKSFNLSYCGFDL